MAEDRRIQEAVEIGRRNARVIELIQNWCAHARIVHAGGVGLVEQTTGLPIGARSIRCPHARAPGWGGGVDLERTALDFHDRNCVGCEHRVPVKLPNLSDLVGRRDAERERSATALRDGQDLERREVERRATARQHLARAGDHARNSLLELLGEFDRDPSDQNLAAIEESSRAIPTAFDRDLQEVLFDIALSEGFARARGALTVLRDRAEDRSRLVSTALAVLARYPIDVALSIFVAESTLADRAGVEGAATSLLRLAHPPSPRIPGLPGRELSAPEGLLIGHRIAPGAVEPVLRRWLRDDNKERRRSAALCVLDIMKAHDPGIAERFAGDLISSFSCADDGYDGGPASRTVSRVLAEALATKTAEVDDELSQSFSIVDEAGRAGIIRTYIEVFSNAERRTGSERRVRELTATSCERIAFQRLIAFFTALPCDADALRDACDLLADDYRHDVAWDLLSDAVAVLLGAAALAYDQIAQGPSSPVHDPRPAFVQQLEKQNRDLLLERCIEAALHVVTTVARDHPDPAVRSGVNDTLLQALANAPEHSERLRGGLVATLGKAGSHPAHLSRILPIVYRAITDRSVVVRGSAIEAYSHLVEIIGPSGIPDLLHEVVVSTLGDPYLYVHQRALTAVEDITLPPPLQREAANRVVLLALTHVSAKRWDLARQAIRVWLRFARRRGTLTPQQRATVIAWLGEFDPNEASSLLRDVSYSLRQADGYPLLLLKLLENDKSWDTSQRTFIDEFERLTPEQVISVQQPLAAIATKRWALENDISRRIFWLLVRAEAWAPAATVGRALVDALEDTTENRPARLRLRVIAAAANLESAAASGNVKAVVEYAREIRQFQQQIALDDKANEDVRGLFPPVRRPS